jgi:hypothetical protein
MIDQDLLLRNEYLAAENHILRAHVPDRLRLSDPERATLAEIGKRLGREALRQISCVAKPDTILGWYRKLIAHKFDGSKLRSYPGRPRITLEVEKHVEKSLLSTEILNEEPAEHWLPLVLSLDYGGTTYTRPAQERREGRKEETDFDLVNDSSSSARGVRGGYWNNSSFGLLSSARSSDFPTFESSALGFRVASIPEPSTLLLLCFGSLAVLWRRRAAS